MAQHESMQRHYDDLIATVIESYPLAGVPFRFLLTPMMRLIPTKEAEGEQFGRSTLRSGSRPA